RIYTTEHRHPYDEVTWQRRDVVMTNWRDGTVNFEQRGVEFPDFWSVNAVNIVTSKYFRGAVGSEQREASLRPLIDRVVATGTASGPVSFMRGADASAGTIKSGGATRRAAKMVVLDVDHPDIAEFVQTKASEERKIRVLRDAGFDMDLGGKDITSVQYQNANN